MEVLSLLRFRHGTPCVFSLSMERGDAFFLFEDREKRHTHCSVTAARHPATINTVEIRNLVTSRALNATEIDLGTGIRPGSDAHGRTTSQKSTHYVQV